MGMKDSWKPMVEYESIIPKINNCLYGFFLAQRNIHSKKMANLEPVIQSEVSQEEKNKYHVITHICGI